MTEDVFDLLIVGGGVNGCGIARDAVGRGYSVVLAEMGDLASGTSSASTKLVHGGLRYLKQSEFRLVREALREREVLWRNAPHIIRPGRFILPVVEGLSSAWLIRIGLLLYDTLGGFSTLGRTRPLDLRKDPAGKPLKKHLRKAFEYSDCIVDDARLVVFNAMDAAKRGASIRTHTKVIRAEEEGDHWAITLQDMDNGRREFVRARMIVNAAGPWADEMLPLLGAHAADHHLRLVKGSHIVIPRKFDDPRAYIFQNRDGRIIFAIPYEQDFTLIGTTDEDFAGDPGEATISEAETRYLCEAASAYFEEPVTLEEVVWSYAGVRPLYDDGAARAQDATRDYVLKVDRHGALRVLNVFGGKITTYRRLAEAALGMIAGEIGQRGREWTADAPLPGGDFPAAEYDRKVMCLLRAFPFLDRPHARRLVRLYGTLAHDVLGTASSVADLGRHFGADLYECELCYLAAQEWARSGEDVLWRRTKLGLHLSEAERAEVAKFMHARNSTPPLKPPSEKSKKQGVRRKVATPH
ncbi:glycerol-3-phosphate dehydrogenase [Nitratireductor aestuarii]|uniref:Glycerol-3-phosphate dehydrogenase n=1 Tax=Nitratireductor aestuarii TaxID=1735103 RepID=A0A916REJ5_9HYPH|nr:glycerol-3-phosphate dehydrogenase [Nitratireductor aestuarii]GGA53291.1 glycerol-3-phosphate dehydrogenase [Nitratireductor aestuarii]